MTTDQASTEGLVSIVIPVRDEEPNVAPLCAELAAALERRPFEVIFVDDGSTDGTFEAVKRERERDARIHGLRFRSPRGKAAAYEAGFRSAAGSVVATMDGDQQDDPRDLVRLLETLEGGADLVVGWKQTGKSSPLAFVISRCGNLLLRLLTKLKLHDMNCPLRVMRPGVARSLELRADLHRYIPLLAAARGFSVAEVPVSNRKRVFGASKYGGTKYLSSTTALLGVGLYLRFGERPMMLFGGVGLLGFLAGLAVCGTVAVRFLFLGADIDDDIPTLVLGVLLTLIGTQFLGIGLLAEILVRRLRIVESAAPLDVVEEI